MHPESSARAIIGKTIITHTVTYFVMGLLAYTLLDYHHLYAETELRLIFGVVFAVIRRAWLGQPRGWVRLWGVLAGLGILGTFGPSPGSIEGAVYTTLPLRLHAIGLPEVLLQALLLSLVVWYWMSHPEARWLRWTMGVAFVIALALPALGLLVGQQR
jgi:hypothetical protein